MTSTSQGTKKSEETRKSEGQYAFEKMSTQDETGCSHEGYSHQTDSSTHDKSQYNSQSTQGSTCGAHSPSSKVNTNTHRGASTHKSVNHESPS
jgi:hypothetical protein